MSPAELGYSRGVSEEGKTNVPKRSGASQPRQVVDTDRRAFIRKAAYVPPALVALGLVARTGRAQLASQPPPPPSLQEEDPMLDDIERQQKGEGD